MKKNLGDYRNVCPLEKEKDIGNSWLNKRSAGEHAQDCA